MSICQVTIEDIYYKKLEALDLAYKVIGWTKEFFQEMEKRREIFRFDEVIEAYREFIMPYAIQIYKNKDNATTAVQLHIVGIKANYTKSVIKNDEWNFKKAVILDLENLVYGVAHG